MVDKDMISFFRPLNFKRKMRGGFLYLNSNLDILIIDPNIKYDPQPRWSSWYVPNTLDKRPKALLLLLSGVNRSEKSEHQ